MRDGLDNLPARNIGISRIVQQRRDESGHIHYRAGRVGPIKHMVREQGLDGIGVVGGDCGGRGAGHEGGEGVVRRGEDGDVGGGGQGGEEGGEEGDIAGEVGEGGGGGEGSCQVHGGVLGDGAGGKDGEREELGMHCVGEVFGTLDR